jgi:putative SOS response-associated peptidase YedK
MAEMERYWALTDAQIRNPLEQRFNIAPTTMVPMIYQATEGVQLVGAGAVLVEGATLMVWKLGNKLTE